MIEKNVLNSFNNKRCLVTGGTGLIGRQVVDILLEAGAHVETVSLDRNVVSEEAVHTYGDLRNFEFCQQITTDRDYVFHIAGIKGSVKVTRENPSSFFVPLIMMNTNILEASRLNKVSKLVYTSSVGAYSSAEVFVENENLEGEPMDEFPGWAKRMAEKQIQSYAKQYGLGNFAIVRPANIYGPGDNFDPNNAMVIPSLMARIAGGENPMKIWGDGSAIRDFAYSRDVAEGIVLALFHGTGGGFVNLGSGVGCTIRELVETLQKVIGFEFEFDKSKPSGFPKRVMDISLAKKMINYDPTVSLEDGLRMTWDWYCKNSDEHLQKQNYFTEENYLTK